MIAYIIDLSQWFGFSDEEKTWEPKKNLTCVNLIARLYEHLDVTEAKLKQLDEGDVLEANDEWISEYNSNKHEILLT